MCLCFHLNASCCRYLLLTSSGFVFATLVSGSGHVAYKMVLIHNIVSFVFIYMGQCTLFNMFILNSTLQRKFYLQLDGIKVIRINGQTGTKQLGVSQWQGDPAKHRGTGPGVPSLERLKDTQMTAVAPSVTSSRKEMQVNTESLSFFVERTRSKQS
ncbi:hypothetical protein ATANTOWER_007806 [Ataeniobius toweri]|uniref:Uncharacterized protein n=1 Tax=Ataeniobius toweri TaxID=208326 RepID=A0ABU7A5L3_9TELE|nr:hypothetical protein [Ataeniobius toweri]